MPAQRDRSVSGDLDDSDGDSIQDIGDGSLPAGRPGRKKNPNSQAARRDQNRIAQREFRLRKQQRIRDLEASVEILSGGKDEALTQLRQIMKDLMQENQVLRQLLRSLSNFIGDGAGGLLPKLGWDMNDFNNFVNRSETDTAWESYQRHKRDEPQTPSTSATSQKRPSDDDPNSRAKRARPGDSNDGDRDAYPLLVPVNSAVPPIPANGLYPSTSASRQHEQNMFNDLMRPPSGGGSTMFAPPTSPPNSFNGGSAGGLSANQYQPSSYSMAPMNVNVDPALPGMSLITNPATMPPPRGSTVSSPATKTSHGANANAVDDDQDPKRHEAYKLIQYHLDNYKRNSAYCLPSSLRPTLVQRTVPHESVIDSILHPELRDRMILLRGRFDLVDCLHDYRTAITIHGDDVLAHGNWEISDSWLQRYKFLVDPATLTVVNRWRRERGEPELLVSDYVTAEGNSAA
ncbi:hypothetical protein PHLGIDRAFT_113414 [Phlebiopsis gigantea 11061_1 CR5-6]|uniref:BZIP domain-containing protein n=1 Tax=Phlebiopsis gigantea (strain 11061_1 CR5-6) TaxID=745531 RepID=A0A0C3SFX1_PHLG1|nr:hypothetical protein PHLGIDRAFT_113414 [Phlebiopsis gigantea 11061_1 CR5-6]